MRGENSRDAALVASLAASIVGIVESPTFSIFWPKVTSTIGQLSKTSVQD